MIDLATVEMVVALVLGLVVGNWRGKRVANASAMRALASIRRLYAARAGEKE